MTARRDRYAVVERVAVLGSADCARLAELRVVVVGCGALGSAVATHLARGGLGAIRVVDRDVVEVRNLTHQVLYTQDDADSGALKAEAAATALGRMNPECAVEALVADYVPGNALRLVDGADLIVDGADSLETKLLLNDVAVATGTPLVYAGCAGTEGAVLAVAPGVTHCLRCLWPTPGAAAQRLTCQTRGVLPGAVAAVAALAATEATKLLLGFRPAELNGLVRVDVWDAGLRRVPLPAYRPEACPACGERDFRYLRGEYATSARELCGDDTVLLVSPNGTDLRRLTERHRGNDSLRAGPESVQLVVEGCRVVVFSSGRTVVHGAGGASRARSIHARHVLG